MKEKSTALLDIEKIVKASEDTQMKGQFLTKNAQPLERLANKLGISKEQATLFAIIAYSSYCSTCSLSDIKRHLDCKTSTCSGLLPTSKHFFRQGSYEAMEKEDCIAKKVTTCQNTS
jgi:hypothetical protein